jgi:hypothetical protein
MPKIYQTLIVYSTYSFWIQSLSATAARYAFSHMRETLRVRALWSPLYAALVLLHRRRRRPTEDWKIERRARFFWANSSLRLLNGRTLDGGAFNWSLSSMRIIVTLCARHTCVRMARGEMRHDRKSDVNEKWDYTQYATINKMPWMRTGPLKQLVNLWQTAWFSYF